MSKNRLESVGGDSKIKNCFLLDILNYREISSKIESDFKVIHESPQVLIIQMENAFITHLITKLTGIESLNYL